MPRAALALALVAPLLIGGSLADPVALAASGPDRLKELHDAWFPATAAMGDAGASHDPVRMVEAADAMIDASARFATGIVEGEPWDPCIAPVADAFLHAALLSGASAVLTREGLAKSDAGKLAAGVDLASRTGALLGEETGSRSWEELTAGCPADIG